MSSISLAISSLAYVLPLLPPAASPLASIKVLNKSASVANFVALSVSISLKSCSVGPLAADATVDYVMNKEEYEASRRDPVMWKWAGALPFGNSAKSLNYVLTEEIEK